MTNPNVLQPTPMEALIAYRYKGSALPFRTEILTPDEAFVVFTALHGEAWAIQALDGIVDSISRTYDDWLTIVSRAVISPEVREESFRDHQPNLGSPGY